MYLINIFSIIFLLLISIEDIKTYEISETLLISFFVVVLCLSFHFEFGDFAKSVFNALFFCFFFWIISVVTKGLGLGDVKLIGIIAFVSGFFDTIFICLVACVDGIIIFCMKRVEKKDCKKIAFAPCLFIGFLLDCIKKCI